jgi:hypothetical protein
MCQPDPDDTRVTGVIDWGLLFARRGHEAAGSWQDFGTSRWRLVGDAISLPARLKGSQWPVFAMASYHWPDPEAAAASQRDPLSGVELTHRLRGPEGRPCLALQLPFLKVSESMGNHDSKIVDAGSVD